MPCHWWPPSKMSCTRRSATPCRGIDEADAAHGLHGRGNGEQHVLGAGLHQHRPRRHEGAEVLVLEAAEHAEHDLGTTHVPRHLVALRPRGEVAAHHRRRDPVVDRGRHERDRPAVGDADHAEPRRIDERVPLEQIEAAPQIPDVLGQRVPTRHRRVDEVGVAGVVVLGVPVLPLAEAAQVRGEHDIPAADQLEAVVGVGHLGVLESDDLALAGPVPVAADDGRAGRGVSPRVGNQQVGGYRHGVLGVEDDLVPAVAVAGHRLERLDVERHRFGLRPRSSCSRTRVRSIQAGRADGSPSGKGSSGLVAARRAIHWYQGE